MASGASPCERRLLQVWAFSSEGFWELRLTLDPSSAPAHFGLTLPPTRGTSLGVCSLLTLAEEAVAHSHWHYGQWGHRHSSCPTGNGRRQEAPVQCFPVVSGALAGWTLLCASSPEARTGNSHSCPELLRTYTVGVP